MLCNQRQSFAAYIDIHSHENLHTHRNEIPDFASHGDPDANGRIYGDENTHAGSGFYSNADSYTNTNTDPDRNPGLYLHLGAVSNTDFDANTIPWFDSAVL